MGISETIKDFYFNLEAKYYDLMDKVNEKVPVYEIIDPIDRVVPSFIVFVLLALLVGVFIVGAILGAVFPGQNNSLAISVAEEDGTPIEGAFVIFMRGEEIVQSTQTDALGIAKLPGIEIDQQIEVSVEKEGYLTENKSVLIFELPQAEQITLLKESEAFTTKTIRLLDELGQPIVDSFDLKFRCSNPYAPSIRDVSLAAADRGEAEVQVPNNCDRLTVDVSGSSRFAEKLGQVIVSDDEAIYLSEEEGASAQIIVNVADSSGRPLDGIQVELYKYTELLENPNVGPIDVDYTAGGKAEFTKAAGSYIAKTYDAAGSYGEQSSEKIVAQAGESKTVTITLREEIKGKIKFKVTDKKSKAPVPNAYIKVLDLQGSELTTVTTISSGLAEVNISRDVAYKAIVSAEGFQLTNVSNLRISETEVVVELDKCTPTTCGSLKVKVVDQDNEPIIAATVVLYNSSTNFIAGYNNRPSDINGVAKFFGVSSGNYYAFAFKEGYSGRSDSVNFSSALSESGEAHLTVKMDVGEGSVKIVVKDEDARAVPFATITLVDGRDNKAIGTDITDFNGVKEFIDIKANRRIYIVASKSDEQTLATYTTVSRPILASTVQQFDITLEKPILKKAIEMEFLGLFSEDGKRAQNVKAGDIYKAKFKVRVPEEKEYKSAGVHLRTGQDVLMEKDEIVIRKLNAPRAAQIRATSFEPESSGLAEDKYDVTAGDAKWINAEWRDPKPGIYEVEAEIEIKNSASIGDKLFLNYRAWAIDEDNKRERFPVDDTVTKELYSNTKQEIFQVGVVTLCDENFCFTATITDKEGENPGAGAGLSESITDTYNAKIFNPYKLQFIITNNSESTIHNSANLRIKNFDESLKFFEYIFTDSQTEQRQGIVNGFTFPRLDVGDLRSKNSLRLETDFTPQKAINGILNIQLVSDQQIVFEKNLTIAISSPKELSVQIEPQFYLSGVQNDIAVTVKDSATTLEIENAIVRLKDRRGNVVDFARTRKDGIATLTLPGQKPGDILRVEVEKIDYNVKILELTVSDKLLEITPGQIGVSLNTKNKTQSNDKISLRNVAPYDLTIKGIKLSGNFKKLVDTARVRNWLDSSYRGLVIKSEERQEIELQTFLSQDAQSLSSRASFDGELIIVAANFGQEWVFKVPTKIAIGLGEEVDDPTCLVVTRSEWITSTSGTPKRIEFQIQNNCTVGSRPIALQDLEAKVNWKTNQLGEYSLAIGSDEAVLRPGYYRLLLGTIQPEQSITATLSFTPFGGVNGTGEADVVIQATNPLDNEDQVLQNTIKTKITSINLGQCVTYDKERVIINQDETGSVSVTAQESCGEPIKFEIESELQTTPSSTFTLQPGTSQIISVFAQKNYPGQYALYILPQFSSDKKEQLTKNVRVLINSPGCWQLSKYEFDVYDNPKDEFDGFDVANLTNNCVEKPVQVKVNAKDWLDAAQDGLFWGLASMGVVMLTNAVDNKVDWLGRETDPVTGELIQQKQDLESLKKKRDEINKQIAEKEKAATTAGTSDAEKQKLQQEIQTLNNQKAALEKELQSKMQQEAAQQTNTQATKTQPNGAVLPGLQAGHLYQKQNGTWYDVTNASAKVAVSSTSAISSLDGKLLESEKQKALAKVTADQQAAAKANEPEQTGVILPEEDIVIRTPISSSDILDPYRPLERPDTEQNIPSVANVTLLSGKIDAIPPLQALVTGYAPVKNPFVGSIAQGAGGGIAGGLLQGGSGIVRNLFGTSPWSAGVLGFLAGTVISYIGQEKEVTFTVLEKDAEIKTVTLVQGAASTEKKDSDIGLEVEGLGDDEETPTVPQPLENNPDLISQGIETFRTIFTNITNFKTTVERPKYSSLKVDGIRHKYVDKTYDKKDFINESGGFLGFFDNPVLDTKKGNLDEDTPDKLEQRFRLEFNSVPPEVERTQDIALLNCQDGTRVGSTGADALPKVKFDWTWKDIEQDTCNENNPNGVYCDATQFSIALLKKIDAINKFVSANGASFTCPSPLEDKAAENDIGSFDIGLEGVLTTKNGNDVEVVATIKNTNPGQIETSTTIKLQKPNASGEIACPAGVQKTIVAAGGSAEARCTFTGLAQGFYNAKADIVPAISCENCEDIAATNSLSKTFFAGQSGLAQCEPYSTSRLSEFLVASGIKNDKMVSTVKFNALLMADGYSTDFQRDFDKAQAQTFFSAPAFYTDQRTGLGVYMRDPKLLSFDAYSQPDFALPGPGTYSVTIDITYNTNSWQLFDSNSAPNAKINIVMEKLKGAQPDSPFYYLPIDGLVGLEDGRVGYGVNFAGDSIVIDNNPQPVRTVEISGSSPIEDGVLSVTESDSFKSMQIDERGVVAKLSRAQGAPSLLFQPSNATAVILQIDKNSGDDAYAIYEPAIDGDAVDVGQTSTFWNGIGASCRGFDDEVMSQQQFIADTHGLSTRCALVGPNPTSKYALEFCGEPVNFGSVFYETVFYTPQDSVSYLQLVGVASDEAKLITSKVTADRVELNGNGKTAKITSVEDIFNLVKDEFMCVSGTNINSEFFWNPKKVFSTIQANEEAALEACIPAQINR